MKNFEYCVWPLQNADYYKAKLKELNEREKTRTNKQEDIDVNKTFKENTRELAYLIKQALGESNGKA